MKNIFVLFVILCFSVGAFAQINNSNLSLTDKPDNNTKPVIEKSFDPLNQKAPKEKDFTFVVNPYLWFMATGGTVEVPSISSTPYNFNQGFSDAVDDMKMAFMLSGRFKYKSVSLLYDMFYVHLKPNLSIPYMNAEGFLNGTADINQFVGDFALAYRIPLEDKTVQFDVYGGTRVWSMDNTLDLIGSNGLVVNQNKTNVWVDPIFGALVNFDFEQNWFTFLRGDIGGFGAASKFTSTFLWGVGYRFDQHWNSTFGIKDLFVDYEKDNKIWNVWQYGLLLSVGYRL
jgi:hypothetical protein